MTSSTKLKLLSLACVAYFALTIYWDFNYLGPAKLLGQIQISMFGKYWSVLNLIILNIPTSIAFRLIKSKTEYSKNSNESEIPADKVLFSNIFTNPLAQDLIRPAGLFALTIILVCITGGQAFAPDLGVVKLSSIETGQITQSSYYAQVSGYADPRILQTQKGKKEPWVYMALHQEPESNEPVHLIIASPVNEMKQYIMVEPKTKKLTVHGYVNSSVEGEVRTWLQDEGVVIADDVKRLLPRINGGDRGYIKNWTLGLGLGGIALSVYIFMQSRRNRRKKSA